MIGLIDDASWTQSNLFSLRADMNISSTSNPRIRKANIYCRKNSLIVSPSTESAKMMNYRKGRNVEDELTRNDIKIENLPDDFLWMHVKGGTTVPNVTEFAKKALQSGEHRNIVWTGYGGGVGKAISCAEILKRDFQLHQITRLCFKMWVFSCFSRK